MEPAIARIFVQQSFCTKSVESIRSEILNILTSSMVKVYPLEALVVFNFHTANEVSEVLNLLTRLGYPPKEDA